MRFKKIKIGEPVAVPTGVNELDLAPPASTQAKSPVDSPVSVEQYMKSVIWYNGSSLNNESKSSSSQYSSVHSDLFSDSYTESTLSRLSLLTDYEVHKFKKHIIEKQNCIRELYFTEWQFSQDLAVVVRVYMCSSASLKLFPQQIQTLFSNITEVFELSLSFLEILRAHIPPRILGGDGYVSVEDIKAETNVHIGQAMCLAFNSTFYQVYETYLHASDEQMKLYWQLATNPSTIKQQHQQNQGLSRKYTRKLKLTFSKKSLEPDIDLEEHQSFVNWLSKCDHRAEKLTVTKSLDLLLFKPVQRISKYPLFLKTLTECTQRDHEDYEHLLRANNRITKFIQSINARF